MKALNKNINLHITNSFLTLSPANQAPKYRFIFLHGLDMSVHRLSNVFLSNNIIDLLDDFKVHLPQAPIKQMEYLGRREGPCWYNFNQPSFNRAAKHITDIVQKEIEEVDNDPSRVFLGGFSQGSAMALHVGFTLGQTLGGVIAVGGFYSEYSQLVKLDKEIPDVLVVHGLKDDKMTWEHAQERMKPFLGKPNVKVDIIPDMAHDLYSEEAKKSMHDFIRERAKAE